MTSPTTRDNELISDYVRSCGEQNPPEFHPWIHMEQIEISLVRASHGTSQWFATVVASFCATLDHASTPGAAVFIDLNLT
jgi:hypothetical protein